MTAGPVWPSYGVPFAFIIVAVVFSLLNTRFATSSNIFLILQQASIDATTALGLTMILVGGGIDLSQGSVTALSAAVAGSLIAQHGVPEMVAIGFGLVAGVFVGFVNGFFAEHGEMAPEI